MAEREPLKASSTSSMGCWLVTRCYPATSRTSLVLVPPRVGERLLAGEGCNGCHVSALQALLEYLRIALIVVQRRPLLGQAGHRAGLEAALAEPVRGAGGEHEQGGQ